MVDGEPVPPQKANKDDLTEYHLEDYDEDKEENGW